MHFEKLAEPNPRFRLFGGQENHRDFAAAFRANFPERRGLAVHPRTRRVPLGHSQLLESPTEASRATYNSSMERMADGQPVPSQP